MLLSSVILVFSFLTTITTAADNSDVQIQILKESPCAEVEAAAAGDHLEVHYVGRLENENGEEFDSSRRRDKTYKFQLGAGQVQKVKKNTSHEI